MEVTKNRPSLEKFWYEWHGWLTRYIPEYFHKSASNVKKKKKKKIMELFERKNQKILKVPLMINISNTKVKAMKNQPSWNILRIDRI